MLFQIQKELIQKKNTKLLEAAKCDTSKYEKLKKEYKKLSLPAQQHLSDQLKVYLLRLAISVDDLTFIKLLVDNHSYDKIETPEAKIACGLVYSNIKEHQKVVEFLFPLYEKLNSSELTRLYESLFSVARHQDCEKVLEFAVKRYDTLGWEIAFLNFQIKVGKHKEFIADRLKTLYQQCKTTEEYSRIADCFYKAGYFKDAVNMFDIALQKMTQPKSIYKENYLFDSSRCLVTMNEVIDILKKNGIEAFPAFGSLLGLVRDGKLMDYDKDADVGIFVNSYDEIFKIVSILCKEPQFKSPEMINEPKESHVWNVPIHNAAKSTSVDLFFFYKQPTHFETGVYTACGILKWGFSPFELIQHSLAGKTYLIPNNFEQHLTELYADWREPVEVWDSLLNCPNLIPTSQPVVIYYGLLRLWTALYEGKTKKALNYYQSLTTRWGMKFSMKTEENIKKLLNLDLTEI